MINFCTDNILTALVAIVSRRRQRYKYFIIEALLETSLRKKGSKKIFCLIIYYGTRSFAVLILCFHKLSAGKG